MNRLENPARRRLFRGKLSHKPEQRLPWIISEAVFTSGCDQCQDCIKSCETQIIVLDEQGFPKIDFSKGECTFCQQCIQSCEKPLFKPQAQIDSGLETPWPVTLGINNKCLAKNEIYCRSCQDVCETRAITFRYQDTSIAKPELNLDDCTQCGACIATCPQDSLSFTFISEAANAR
ncbi:ferredoxin-type protein NapF [Thalassomonas actiniarum]|uniref:Ferredoxin-type protein NapF n=1 Tax=Thalassomonas actiniarum TaxID=485447 RepID=A0AAF0C2E5_9GAMM|nr:ferredoxin-type protein NapF [Thalassomonas actiniarum]WDD99996.1 ferredoxin-type protein NapF [Thalassomonas actiniarum]